MSRSARPTVTEMPDFTGLRATYINCTLRVDDPRRGRVPGLRQPAHDLGRRFAPDNANPEYR